MLGVLNNYQFTVYYNNETFKTSPNQWDRISTKMYLHRTSTTCCMPLWKYDLVYTMYFQSCHVQKIRNICIACSLKCCSNIVK